MPVAKKTLKEKQEDAKKEVTERRKIQKKQSDEKQRENGGGRVGGRQKGTPNKRKRMTEELVEQILKRHKFDPFEAQVVLAKQLQEDINQAVQKKNQREKTNAQALLAGVLKDMTPVVYAKRKALETEQNVNVTQEATLTIVTTKEHSIEAALKKAEEDAKEEDN